MKNKIKILVLHPPLYPVNYQFYNLLGKVVDLNLWQFGEYPSDHPSWNYNELKKLNSNIKLKVLGKGSDSLKNQFEVFKYTKELKELKPDIVLSVAFWMPSLYISLIRNIFGFKFLILTDAIKETEKNNSILRNLIRKIICKNTDAFISASNLTSEFIVTLDKKAKIYLSTQTVDISSWNKEINKLEEKDYLKKEFLIDENKIIMLGVGNYIQKKNWIPVINSLKNFDNLLFLLVGDGEEREKYKQLIKNEQLEKQVILVGRKSGLELKKYFKISDFMIFPSLYDQFGFVVAEALASDLPVLCTKNAGAESLIIEGYNGFKFNINEDLKNHLEKIILHLDTLKENTYISIENKTLENKTSEFEQIFIEVLKK